MYEKILKEVKKYIARKVTDVSYDTWIKDLKIVDVENDVYYLITSNAFSQKILEERYTPKVTEAFRKVTGSDIEVRFVTKEENVKGRTQGERNGSKKNILREPINLDLSEYTFDTFVAQENNHFAYNAAKLISESSLYKYNPLVLYGPHGTGKSHLLRAIFNYKKGISRNAKVQYITIQNYCDEIVRATIQGQKAKLRENLCVMDILLIDDLQFSKDKKWVQESLFHLMNDCALTKTQIVIAVDQHVKNIGLEEWLQCRLEQGLMLRISPPNLETMLVILENKAKGIDLALSDDVKLFIAENCSNNVMLLEGHLKKLDFISKQLQRDITISFCKKVILDSEE